MKLRNVFFVPYRGGDCQTLLRHDCNAVWFGTSFEDIKCFQTKCVNPSQACSSAIGDENVPIIGNNSCGFRKTGQSSDMFAGVVIDDFDGILTCVCHKNASALRIEGTVVK